MCEPQSEAQLAGDAAQIRLILDNAHEAFVVMNAEGLITDWNREAEATFGWPKAEAIGRSLAETIIPPLYREGHANGLKRYLETGVGPMLNQRTEIQALHRDGHEFPVELTISPVQWGKERLFAAFVHDISDRKRAEESLRASEERYRALFENNPHPMFVSDTESLAFLAVNDAMIACFGYSRDEFLRMTINDIRLSEEAYRPSIAESTAGAAKSKVSRHRRKDGVVLEVQLTWHGWEFDGRPARIVVAHDVSERRRLEAQLRQAQKMEAVGQLAGGVAHDFNNLLTVINGFGEILLTSLSEDDPRREHAQLIVQSGDQAADLTKQLLAFSRKQMLQPQLLSLNDLLTRLVRLLRAMVGDDIEVCTTLATDLHLVKVDPNQLEQVIINLAVNARDAMPEGGLLNIRTENVDLSDSFLRDHPEVIRGQYVQLTVRDTGCGMDSATKSRLFEPFFTTKELGKGTGLGLATIYGIIKQSNGYIYVDSEPGRGAAFCIYLPAEVNALAGSAASRHSLPTIRGHERVLVVDDEERVRSMVCQSLQSHGYAVCQAASGDQALALYDQQKLPFDLLVTDMVMPRMSGRQLAERLLHEQPELKVLFISGHTSDLSAICTSKGHIAFLAKPFTPTTLLAKVREVLDADTLSRKE